MDVKENFRIKGKNTMRIGGDARWFVEMKTKEDVEATWKLAEEKNVPLILLGAGSNTIFADTTIEAVIAQVKYDQTLIDGNIVTVSSGKNLAMLINELATKDLDLSALTGIPGTIGGAIFGNAGQGPTGKWINSFVKTVEFFDGEKWQIFTAEQCNFRYRESFFKDLKKPIIIWNVVLEVPSRPAAEVKADIEMLLKKRIETQPHVRTAGSCFKAVGGTPAWKMIDAAGLRGLKVGGVEISAKHANFLLSSETATFEDAKAVVKAVKEKIPHDLEVEMRFIEKDGQLAF